MLIIILIAEKISKRANNTQEKSFRKAQRRCYPDSIYSKQWNPQSHTSYVSFWYSKKCTHRSEGKQFKKTQRVCYLDSISTIGHVHGEAPSLWWYRMYIATHLIHTPQLDIQYSRFHGASETCKGDLNMADNHFLSYP